MNLAKNNFIYDCMSTKEGIELVKKGNILKRFYLYIYNLIKNGNT